MQFLFDLKEMIFVFRLTFGIYCQGKGFRLTAACLGGSWKQRSYNQRNWPPEINDITK